MINRLAQNMYSTMQGMNIDGNNSTAHSKIEKLENAAPKIYKKPVYTSLETRTDQQNYQIALELQLKSKIDNYQFGARAKKGKQP